MVKYVIAMLFFFCIPQVMYADDFGSSLYNLLVNGIEIPLLHYTHDISATDNDWEEICYGQGLVVSEANNTSVLDLSKPITYSPKKYNSINRQKQILPCIKQLPGKIISLGYVKTQDVRQQKAGLVMTYKFMPLDFLFIASLSYTAYWFYKNKYAKN